jgi:DNA-directed RNA polymerase subunit RPC12/RpoP
LFKKISIFLAGVVFLGITILESSQAEDSSIKRLKAHRQALLDNFVKNIEIYSSGRMAQSSHFRVRIDLKSQEDLKLSKERLGLFFQSLLFIFEEAYELVGSDFDYYPSGKFDIQILSKGEYNLQTDQSGKYILTVSHSGLEMPFTTKQARSVLRNFKEETQEIYGAYTRMLTYGGKGPEFHSEEAKELADFEKKRALACSRWLQAVSIEEQKNLIKEFNEENSSFYQRYSSYIRAVDLNKKTMKCKWCGHDMDITGKRKGRRIKCPRCRNFVVIGE